MSDFRKSIRKQIQSPAQPSPVIASIPANILSGLNILRVLEDKSPTYLSKWLHYEPQAFATKSWANVVVWFRPTGYHNYQTLSLLGAWALQKGDQTEVTIGLTTLQYSAPVFHPESYQTVMKRTYQPYYGEGKDAPQGDNITLQFTYNAMQRLVHRQACTDAINTAFRRVHL